MQLGYNTNGLQNHRLEDALRLLADHGYEVVALTLDVGHLDPKYATPRQVDTVAALLDRLGLATVIETGGRFLLDSTCKHEPTLMTRDQVAREKRLNLYGRAAEIGLSLGAKVLSFWTGIDRSPDGSSQVWLDAGVELACDRIRAIGLTPALEPEPGMAVANLADFAALRGRLGVDGPDLTLDIGHLYVNEVEPPIELIRELDFMPVQVHLEDIRRGVHEHLIPGEGDVEFAAIFAALRARQYAGPVCFELSRHSHMAAEAVSLCRDVWQQMS